MDEYTYIHMNRQQCVCAQICIYLHVYALLSLHWHFLKGVVILFSLVVRCLVFAGGIVGF